MKLREVVQLASNLDKKKNKLKNSVHYINLFNMFKSVNVFVFFFFFFFLSHNIKANNCKGIKIDKRAYLYIIETKPGKQV